ncbi:Alpha/Beta hydrolase protein [Thelephora terrestris]|uniref:Alpha/Beta hydrolase protein n=1 Tax=Thelephora terrestris TaxID=56493 RepID=A0A9P6HP93_9AGAM|nr:Alpha/Beta hydrolase protein [Thelephora terrestris]
MSAGGFTTGEIDFIVPSTGQATKTWYKVYGDLANRKNRPLVALHGGPGVVHDYMLSLSDLWTKNEIPVIFYDQIGGGESTHLPEKNGDGDFWSVKLFIAELNNLLKHLKIDEDFDLLGNSWGAMLAAEFATTKPKGLKNLVLASGPASMELFMASQKEKLARLPQEIQDTLKKYEDAGTTDDPEYKKAMMPFLVEYVCRLKPPPAEFMVCLDWLEKDPTVYYTMNGPSEFHIIGTLKTWSIVDRIPEITYRTLLTNGRYDEVDDNCLQPFFDKLQKVKWIQFSESSHLAHWEERDRYMEVVAHFLEV